MTAMGRMSACIAVLRTLGDLDVSQATARTRNGCCSWAGSGRLWGAVRGPLQGGLPDAELSVSGITVGVARAVDDFVGHLVDSGVLRMHWVT